VQFIPVAEEYGLIVELGAWIFAEVCKLSVRASASGHVLPLSINVSLRQFQQEGFVQSVKDILQQTGVNPANLVLEVTESLLGDEMGAAEGVMVELSASGAGVFGSFAGNPGSCLGLTSGAGVLLGLAEKAIFFGLQRESFLGLASGSGFFLGLASDARLLFSFPGTSLRLGFPRKPVFFGFPGERFFSFALHPCLFLGRSGGAGLLLDLAGDALLFSFAGERFVSFALRPGLFLGYAGGPRLFLGLTGGAGLRLGFARRLSLFCPCRLN
jgi:hypothetical protein